MNQPIRQKAISQRLSFADDLSIFRTAIVTVAVEITPQRRKTLNGDCIFRGFIAEKEIEVVIPASRQDALQPLLKLLQTRLQAASIDKNGKSQQASAERVRHKLRIEGVWRVRMLTETNGIPERRFQLVAARWRFRGTDGLDAMFGHLPNQ